MFECCQFSISVMSSILTNLFSHLTPKYKRNNILMLDLKTLQLFSFNPFKVSLKFYFIFNALYSILIIIPTLWFIISNYTLGYETVSQSISEFYFEITKITFNSVFIYKRREISSIIQDLRVIWKKS